MDTEEHDFVSISVVPVDVRVGQDGKGVEYTEAPERSSDSSPEQVCQVCWVPLDALSIKTKCPGPKIPDSPEGLT
jgi:hypothetical protein